jgi:hypothetical protein
MFYVLDYIYINIHIYICNVPYTNIYNYIMYIYIIYINISYVICIDHCVYIINPERHIIHLPYTTYTFLNEMLQKNPLRS